jgi:hypothetical protein
MTTALEYLRQHLLAALALVCSLLSLGGASYAAVSLPANSVGNRELKNRAITAAKFNPTSVAASIRAWAVVEWNGSWRVQGSSRDIRVARTAQGEVINWRHTRFARACIASVTPRQNVPVPGGSTSFDGYVTTAFDGPAGHLAIDGMSPSGTPQVQNVNVLIACPSTGSPK